MYHLEGKTAGITGVSNVSGLGFAITRRLLEEGCRCFIVARNAQKLSAMTEALSAFGEIRGFLCDVSDYKQVSRLADEVRAAYGRIDFYVNNAGVSPNVSIRDMTVEDWDRGFGVNLRSVFLSAKLIAPLIREGGSIVNAASFVSLLPTAGLSMYSASKAGVLSLTRVMAAEFAKDKIRVNAYVPGLMATSMNEAKIAAMPDRLMSQIASHEFGTADDVANAVAFLLSDEARYINGTYLNVSGGKFCTQNPDYAWC